ncbi:hypothetical protein EYF80_016050 [Liparis tanakae]|uniref:Uncharacterized protein n=1 Tax=Liparis tanakae TaxID=230148 RepID=A0A4Z2I759_9TELE|nr:hypothetical protein EYF80_016050 [Liparis tanakae]
MPPQPRHECSSEVQWTRHPRPGPRVGNLGKYIEQKEARRRAERPDSGARSPPAGKRKERERHAQLTLRLQWGFSRWPRCSSSPPSPASAPCHSEEPGGDSRGRGAEALTAATCHISQLKFGRNQIGEP